MSLSLPPRSARAADTSRPVRLPGTCDPSARSLRVRRCRSDAGRVSSSRSGGREIRGSARADSRLCGATFPRAKGSPPIRRRGFLDRVSSYHKRKSHPTSFQVSNLRNGRHLRLTLETLITALKETSSEQKQTLQSSWHSKMSRSRLWIMATIKKGKSAAGGWCVGLCAWRSASPRESLHPRPGQLCTLQLCRPRAPEVWTASVASIALPSRVPFEVLPDLGSKHLDVRSFSFSHRSPQEEPEPSFPYRPEALDARMAHLRLTAWPPSRTSPAGVLPGFAPGPPAGLRDTRR